MRDRARTAEAPHRTPLSAQRSRSGGQLLAGLQRSAGNRAVQRVADSGLADVDGAGLSDRIGAAEGKGGALDGGTAAMLAHALGTHPGDVRIHTDGEADSLARELGAKAFTSGRDVFFREGAFDPSSPEGFGLLVHESTHVLQQAAGSVAGSLTADGALAISDPGDPFEQAARGAGDVVAAPAAQAGRPVQRDDDDWSLGSIASGVSSFVNTAEKDVSAGADFVNTPFRNAAHAVDQSTKAYGDFVDWQENAEHDVVHGIADSVSGVPVLGSVAQSLAGTADTATQLIGGFQEGAVDIAGGMLKTVADPYDATKGVINLAQHLPPAVMMNAGADAIGDLVTGKGLGKAETDLEQGAINSVNSVWGGLTEGDDPNHPGAPKDAGLVRNILDPLYADHAKGKDAHAVGRAGANIGALLFGGELAEAAEGGGVPEAPNVPEVPAVEPVPARPTFDGPLDQPVPPAAPIEEPLPRFPLDDDPPLPRFPLEDDPVPNFDTPFDDPVPGPKSVPPEVGPDSDVPTPRRAPPVDPDLAPDTIPDGVPRKPNFFEDPGLKQPQPRRGIEPNDLPAPDDPLLPEVKLPRFPDPESEVPTPRQASAVDPDLAPDTIPDGVPRKPNFFEDPDLRQPQPRRGVEPNELPAPDDPLLPEVKPRSPLARSVTPGAPPEVEPPLSDPNGPATPNPEQLAQQQEDFEQAWRQFSDKPFGYELLPK